MSEAPLTDRGQVAERAASSAAFSPLYQQIKGLLLQSLDRGDWKPGEAIPSELELAARFQVSQGTVRKAIDELAARSEEHTSELQSLMRISYAVFCLKKKQNNTHTNNS